MSNDGEPVENNADAFDFGIFDEYFDDEVEQLDPNRRATIQEIQLLCEFIGGFAHWELLNDDCKKGVISFLDYNSRCRLERCSKYDYRMVKATPIHVYQADIEDSETFHFQFQEEEFENVIVRIQFSENYTSGNALELIFSQLEQDTQIRWIKYYARQLPQIRSVLLKNCDYYDESVKFVAKWMKKGHYKLTKLSVDMKRVSTASNSIRSLPSCTRLRLGSSDEEVFRWWLQKVPEELDVLQLVSRSVSNDLVLSPQLLSLPQVMNVKELYFWCKAAFSDEQFLSLKANRISFDPIHITDEGINAFLKKWARGEGSSDFKRALLWSEQVRDQQTILRGLHARPWDNEFLAEARGFTDDFNRVCGRGTCFQVSSNVDSYESVTVCFANDRTSFYGTGKRRESGGRIFTDFSVP
ncbi:unnamed protein product [Caenorhabditis sp. 36 PRJEB53466]|nr:unnamed protein product [Caenorhabditis sp. 36 PRJEB53466]